MMKMNLILDDMSGGNYDDAFSGGVESGRIELARELIKFIEYEEGV